MHTNTDIKILGHINRHIFLKTEESEGGLSYMHVIYG